LLICHCAGVRDARVLDAIASGSGSCDAIAAACGAGARCGGCRPLLEQLLAQRERGSLRPPPRMPSESAHR